MINKLELEAELLVKMNELKATDYKALKYSEGCYTEEEYAPVKAQRQQLRNEINNLRAQLEELEE